MKEGPLFKKDPKEGHGTQRGIALLASLMVVLILSILVHRFTFTTRIGLASAANHRDQFQAECLAISGLEAALRLLSLDDTPEVDHLGEEWAMFKGSVDLSLLGEEDGAFLVEVQDESAKIDVNRIVRQDGSTTDPFVRGQLDRLLGLFGVASDARDMLLDCLEDWIDRDSLQKLNGAEDSYYGSLDAPYRAANGPLRSLGELYLIKGWKDVLALRLPDGSTVADYLTVAPTGGRINVNTASPLVLMTLSPEIDESLAEQVITLRQEAPLSGPQLLPPPFRKREVVTHLRYSGTYFRIKSLGVFRKASSVAELLVFKEQDEVVVVSRRIY